jgi:DNA-binding transcriptional MerR regulator
VKRRGNRRYYQRDDVVLIRQIRHLLYEDGFTIGGARQKLSDPEEDGVMKHQHQALIQDMIRELEAVLKLLSDD